MPDQSVSSQEMPYTPSLINRYTRWVESLPVNMWVIYSIVAIGLVLVQILFLWWEKGLYAEELLPVIIFNSVAVPFLLVLIHILDNQAVAAVDSMQPVLDLSGGEFIQYKFRLSNMPFCAPLIAGLVLMVSTILTPLVSTEPVRYAALQQLPVFGVVYHIIDKSSAFLFGVVLYHNIRQLRLVNSINSNHVRINLYHLRPLQAFSRLTASTALGLLVFVYLWMLINPELLADPVLLGYSLIFTLLAVAVFVWPLWGVHRLMEREKGKVLHEIDLRFENVISKLNQRIDDDEYASADSLNRTITSLEIQRKRISDIPTWPWKSETARLALTAIALPLILMIIQYFALQALDR